jgi:hypothetical protein
VRASTPHQTLCALVFRYRHVLGQHFGWLVDVVRAKRPPRLPIVWTRGQSSARCPRGRALDHGEPFIWCWPAPAGVPPTPRQGHGRRQPPEVIRSRRLRRKTPKRRWYRS